MEKVAENENLYLLLEKLFESKELAEKFSACKTLDEFYDFCIGVQKGYTKQELGDMLDELGNLGWKFFEEDKEDLSDEDLDAVAGGVNLSGKILAGTLGFLSFLSPVPSKYVSANTGAQSSVSAVSAKENTSDRFGGLKRFMKSRTFKRLAIAAGAILVVSTAVYFARRALRPNIGIDDGRGLANMGNSCYINATLQQLYSISELRLKVMNYKPSDENIIDETDKKIEAMKTIFKSLDERKPLERKVLKKAVETLGYDGTQQDAKDFLTKKQYIRDALERLKFEVDAKNLDPAGYDSVEKYFEDGDTYCKDHDSTITSLDRNQIIVPFSQRVCDIKDAAVQMSGYNADKKERERILNNAEQKTEGFEVSKEVLVYGSKKELTGVIIKHGPWSGGHYYSYKRVGANQWYWYNDSRVTAVEYEDIKNDIRKNATALVYSSP